MNWHCRIRAVDYEIEGPHYNIVGYHNDTWFATRTFEGERVMEEGTYDEVIDWLAKKWWQIEWPGDTWEEYMRESNA